MRTLLTTISLLACACTEPVSEPQPLPLTSGRFTGAYRVPTTDAGLATASTFTVPRVDWVIDGAIARLDYPLPVGLVGGDLTIRLEGSIEPGATEVVLVDEVGTGTCTATAHIVTCSERFVGLGTLPISLAVVEQVAAAEYAGPASDRLEIANQFASDPIGVVEIDLDSPIDN